MGVKRDFQPVQMPPYKWLDHTGSWWSKGISHFMKCGSCEWESKPSRVKKPVDHEASFRRHVGKEHR